MLFFLLQLHGKRIKIKAEELCNFSPKEEKNMKDYHFQERDPDFGLTVRLDDINEKVKQLEEQDPEDELGDANAFLNAFESENFEAAGEEFPADEEANLGDTKESLPPIQTEPAEPEDPAEEVWEEDEEEEGGFAAALGTLQEMSGKTKGLLAALAVLACVVGFSLVRCGFHPSSAPAKPAGNGTPMVVEGIEADELTAYDIEEEKRTTLLLTEKTEVLDEEGRSVAYGGIEAGDVAMVEVDKDGETALVIDCSDSAIETVELTGLKADTKAKKLVGEDDSFGYHKHSLFLYEEEQITAKDLEPCDLLELRLVDDVAWSVKVLEYHGYIAVEETKNIKDGKIQIDGEDPIPLEEGMRLAAREGQHEVIVTGSNIEERKDTIFVEANEEFTYDLSKAQEKMGVIIVNADVKEYKLYINGAAAESPAVLPLGEYDVVILKNGYKEWSQRVKLDKDSVTVNAQLQKDLQYGTLTITADTEGAWVYINGEEYGVAPMEVNLPYGSYHVQLQKEGYTTYKQTVNIQSTTASLHALMQ